MSAKNLINNLVKKSPWYTNGELKDCKKFWDGINFELDVVNLGSNSAVFGYDYENIDLKCANLAMGPQCLLMDYNILKFYKNHLKEGALVIITLCPFSSMAGYNYLIDSKYHTFLPKEYIPNFSKKTLYRINSLRDNPLSSYPLLQFFKDIKRSFFKSSKSIVNFKDNADGWIKSWKQEFDILDFNHELSVVNKKNREDSASILKMIIDFCNINNFRPVVVLPPVTKELASCMSQQMRKTFIYDYLEIVGLSDKLFFNYLDSTPISEDCNNFQNAYFLNAKGAKQFTEILLRNIEQEFIGKIK